MDKLREDFAEEDRKEEGGEEVRNLANHCHHGYDWNDEKAVFKEKFAEKKREVVGDECEDVAIAFLARDENRLDSAAPLAVANKQNNYRHCRAEHKEEKALRKERRVGEIIFRKIDEDNVRED